MILCTSCDGFGKHFSRPILIKGKVEIIELKCELCNGTGKIKDEKIDWIIKGQKLREYRLEKEITLRKAAKMLGMDASNLSKMERGIIKPKNIWYDSDEQN